MAQFVIITATAVLLVSATVVVHALGTYALIRYLGRYAVDVEGHFKPHKGLLSVIGSATFLLLLHVVEIYLWAAAYLYVVPDEQLNTFEAATYFSFVTFTTLGYGDITLASSEWRILSGIEALDGIILVGWTTALLFAVLQRSWHGMAHRGPPAR